LSRLDISLESSKSPGGVCSCGSNQR